MNLAELDTKIRLADQERHEQQREATCECPYKHVAKLSKSWYKPQELKARNHGAGKCPGDYQLQKYRQLDGKVSVLCSTCYMPEDEEEEKND